MPSKYDTNPLDPDFPEKAEAAAAASEETRTLPYRGGETRQFAKDPDVEQETRRFKEADVSAYSTPYNQPYTGQYVPSTYSPANPYLAQDTHKRRVESIGLPENLVIAAAYLPFYIGLVAGLVLLFLTPKSEPKVRFHAAQGLGAHLGIVLVTILLTTIGGITGGDLGTFIFKIAAFVTLLVFTIKAFRGSPIHIAPLDDLTNWLEDKIRPIK